ncbi:hypothetical protein T484DRAFT_2850313 [Baffinella frigidus]|nr:hypothetical protein T484DRAFT_2850313 [Cryptophyta sp. CCMP2293]
MDARIVTQGAVCRCPLNTKVIPTVGAPWRERERERPSATERRENNVKRQKSFYLKAMSRFWT